MAINAGEPRGAHPEEVRWSVGAASLTLAPSRGRVLQASVRGHDAYWIAPDGEPSDWNVGGDRLWLGPEAAWFWTRLDTFDPETAEVQPALDPGSWRVVELERDRCVVAQEVVLRHQHQAADATFGLVRSFTRIDAEWPGTSDLIAYRTDTVLTVDASAVTGERVSVWSILQVPNGGSVLVGTYGAPTYRDYFDPTLPELLDTLPGALAFRITGTSRHKIGIPPWNTTGALAYARPVAGGQVVIQRRFAPQPWRAYCDRPLAVPSGQGDAVQVYNDGGEFGGFGEVEFHTAAVPVAPGPIPLVDSHVTLVGFVGDDHWPSWRDRFVTSPAWPPSDEAGG
jgi:hypothetical protein